MSRWKQLPLARHRVEIGADGQGVDAAKIGIDAVAAERAVAIDPHLTLIDDRRWRKRAQVELQDVDRGKPRYRLRIHDPEEPAAFEIEIAHFPVLRLHRGAAHRVDPLGHDASLLGRGDALDRSAHRPRTWR